MNRSLIDLKPGEKAIIVELRGGGGMTNRLHRLGLVEGQELRKVSAIAWGGPIVVLVNRAQIAIGRGMARRIIVNVGGGNEKKRDL